MILCQRGNRGKTGIFNAEQKRGGNGKKEQEIRNDPDPQLFSDQVEMELPGDGCHPAGLIPGSSFFL